jgi:hypothetical protein
MPNRRESLALGAAAALAPWFARAAQRPAAPARLQTRLFNLNADVSAEKTADIIAGLKHAAQASGAAGFLIGRNFIAEQFQKRFEWLYMIQFRAGGKSDSATKEDFHHARDKLTSLCRNEAECDLACPLPPGFADAAGVKIRHTVMFSFRPDASPEARQRNIAAIRAMGRLPMVQDYLVQQSPVAAQGPDEMEWQVIGDFASVADFWAYAKAPVHLAIRKDFSEHISRVAFLDVEL